MNFIGSLNFDGKPLARIKRDGDRVKMVFDNSQGDETVLNFSPEAFGQLSKALIMLDAEKEVKSLADFPKGQVSLESMVVNLEKERVAIRGEAEGLELGEEQLPTIIISSVDEKQSLEFSFNKKQALDIERRLRNALEAQDCFKSSLQRKVIEAQ